MTVTAALLILGVVITVTTVLLAAADVQQSKDEERRWRALTMHQPHVGELWGFRGTDGHVFNMLIIDVQQGNVSVLYLENGDIFSTGFTSPNWFKIADTQQ